MSKISKRSGFTLIELLVVISIIGLLSSVVLASLSTARARGRDAKRIQDLIQVRTALELYRDTNGAYPATTNTMYGHNNGYRAASTVCNATYGQNNPGTGATGYVPGLVPNYIPALPSDPRGDSLGKCYMYFSDGVNYKFMAWESMENPNTNHSLKDPGYGSYIPPAPCPSSRPYSYSIRTTSGTCY